MSANPFKDWTETIAAEHNQRVANRKAVAKTVVSAAELVAGKRVRQSHKQPSKVHRDWGDHLKTFVPKESLYEEAITLKLCNGVRYRADWMVIYGLTQPPTAYKITAYECKGAFMYDDARKSLLFAAKEYPWIRFMLVCRQNGQWKQQEILP